MRRRISSKFTFLNKFIAPVLMIIFFADVVFNFSKARIGFELLLIIGLFFVFYSTLTYFLCVPLKYIEIDDNNFYVSNFRREITIPISNIDHVTEFLFSEPRRVTIHLENTTEFGSKIVFLASYRMFAFFSPHPIVDELNRLTLVNLRADQ